MSLIFYAKILFFSKIGAKNRLNFSKIGAKNGMNLSKLGAKRKT